MSNPWDKGRVTASDSDCRRVSFSMADHTDQDRTCVEFCPWPHPTRSVLIREVSQYSLALLRFTQIVFVMRSIFALWVFVSTRWKLYWCCTFLWKRKGTYRRRSIVLYATTKIVFASARNVEPQSLYIDMFMVLNFKCTVGSNVVWRLVSAKRWSALSFLPFIRR